MISVDKHFCLCYVLFTNDESTLKIPERERLMDRVITEGLAIAEPDISDNLRKFRDVKTSSIVSLFAGCGGLDLGFVGGFKFGGRNYKKLPHEIIWANEIDKYACSIYNENLKHDIIEADIWDLLNEDHLPRRADILLGGFPCQDFSQAGQRRGFQSSRGTLYKAVVEAASRLKPKVFIAENVKGLLSIPGAIDTIKRDFKEAGFHGVTEYLVKVANYGVPQNRERIFIIGWRHKRHAEMFKFPSPVKKQMTVREAIDDLTHVDWDEFDGHKWALAKRRPDLQGNEVTPADGLSYTIRAEHHMNIQFHYEDHRRLSVREAARLQSFPDKFKLSSVSKQQGYKMIGNAVPPVMGWHLANAVQKVLVQ